MGLWNLKYTSQMVSQSPLKTSVVITELVYVSEFFSVPILGSTKLRCEEEGEEEVLEILQYF